MKTLNLLALTAASLVAMPTMAIVHGEDAVQSDHQYFARIVYKYDNSDTFSHTCGASILNDKFILTAAHCVHEAKDGLDPKNLYVITKNFTDHKTEVNELRRIKTIHVHPDAVDTVPVIPDEVTDRFFLKENFDEGDIAILELVKPIAENVQSILGDDPQLFWDELATDTKEMDEFNLVGMGTEAQARFNDEIEYDVMSDLLQITTLKPSLSDGAYRCSSWDTINYDSDGKVLYKPDGSVDTTTTYGSDKICATGTPFVKENSETVRNNACSGDSGGPLTVEFGSQGRYQIGVVSTAPINCQTDFIPNSSYTDILYYKDWINSIITDDNGDMIGNALYFDSSVVEDGKSEGDGTVKPVPSIPTPPNGGDTGGGSSGGSTGLLSLFGLAILAFRRKSKL